ncbi:hypothetical protein M758_2G131300 [Ceratodon purpureus]|nr:hypothetical protein M758_2G131300 [Ceratodon purpureus]
MLTSVDWGPVGLSFMWTGSSVETSRMAVLLISSIHDDYRRRSPWMLRLIVDPGLCENHIFLVTLYCSLLSSWFVIRACFNWGSHFIGCSLSSRHIYILHFSMLIRVPQGKG